MRPTRGDAGAARPADCLGLPSRGGCGRGAHLSDPCDPRRPGSSALRGRASSTTSATPAAPGPPFRPPLSCSAASSASRPGRLYLDFGRRAVPPTPPVPAWCARRPRPEHIGRGEKHLVVETAAADALSIGHLDYLAVPAHVCEPPRSTDAPMPWRESQAESEIGQSPLADGSSGF